MHNSRSTTANSQLRPSEQLMQIDQAITLTLQEIDANFARAHQTVTGRILPAVKRYGVASAKTWQTARFWKHFFEVSANVSLSAPSEQVDDDQTQVEDAAAVAAATSTYEDDRTLSLNDLNEQAAIRVNKDSDDELDQSNFIQTLRHASASSPAARRQQAAAAQHQSSTPDEASWAPYESEFERLKKDLVSDILGEETSSTNSILEFHRKQTVPPVDSSSSSGLPQPPQVTRRTPKKSTPVLLRNVLTAEQRRATGSPMLRVTATPRGPNSRVRNPFIVGETTNVPASVRRWNGIADLRKTPLASARKLNASSAGAKGKAAANGDWDDSDDQDDSDASLLHPTGMSPPVTMRFSVPQSRYNKTPAKEAARLVLDDLLRTVGAASPAAPVARSVATRGAALTSIEAFVQRPSVVGTPLRKGRAAQVRASSRKSLHRRDSLPTPPTLTRGHQQPPVSSTTPSGAPRAGSVADVGSGTRGGVASSAARLLDEDEGLSVDERNEEEDVPGSLEKGFSRLVLAKTSAGVDTLLEADEDDSDSDLDSDGSDDSDVPDLRSGSVAGRCDSSGAHSSSGWTATSAVSSRAIDQDTLFGIRPPAMRSHVAAPAAAPVQAASSSSADAFRPWGAVADMGTINGGRALLGERDNTYSAPSPTPAAREQ